MNIPSFTSLNSSLAPVISLPQIARTKRTQPVSCKPISTLVHEVRNPLTNITLSAEMLRSLLKDEAQRSYLDIIMRGATRINSLITELMVPQQRVKKFKTRKHAIHPLLDEVLDMAHDRVSLKNITIRKEYADQDFAIALDRSKMKIALTNIIVNAIESMNPENGELKLVTKEMNAHYVLVIEDNGCGIKREDLKKIFKPYYTNKPRGMGIGLAATSNILRSNHVTVDVESEESVGTRFILVFKKERPV